MSAFTVMSFNIRGAFHPQDGLNDWPQRAALNVATIQKYAPEIIGFQEWQTGNQATYDETLREYAYEMGPVSIRQTERKHHVPIYWKPQRFEMVDKGGFYLSETPDEWSAGWGATLVRAVNWVRLRDLEEDVTFVHLNTHFDHEGDLPRTNSAQLIVERIQQIRQPGEPAIISADFNSKADSEAYTIFRENGYVDTWVETGHTENPNTFHDFRGQGFPAKDLRIDWILTLAGDRRLQAIDSTIIVDEAPPLYPSDHYPITTRLEWA